MDRGPNLEFGGSAFDPMTGNKRGGDEGVPTPKEIDEGALTPEEQELAEGLAKVIQSINDHFPNLRDEQRGEMIEAVAKLAKPAK